MGWAGLEVLGRGCWGRRERVQTDGQTSPLDWGCRREECATIDARFAGSRSMLPLCCLPVGAGARVHVGSRSYKGHHGARRASHMGKRGSLWPSTSPTRKEGRGCGPPELCTSKKRQKAAAELPREKARLAGPKPSRLASPSATHGSAEQRQNTPGQVSEHGLVNTRPARLASP